MKKYTIIGTTYGTDTSYIVEAEDKKTAYLRFVEDVVGFKFRPEQEDEAMKNLCVGNPLFDLVQAIEIDDTLKIRENLGL